jgi:hypothetical protein
MFVSFLSSRPLCGQTPTIDDPAVLCSVACSKPSQVKQSDIMMQSIAGYGLPDFVLPIRIVLWPQSEDGKLTDQLGQLNVPLLPTLLMVGDQDPGIAPGYAWMERHLMASLETDFCHDGWNVVQHALSDAGYWGDISKFIITHNSTHGFLNVLVKCPCSRNYNAAVHISLLVGFCLHLTLAGNDAVGKSSSNQEGLLHIRYHMCQKGPAS